MKRLLSHALAIAKAAKVLALRELPLSYEHLRRIDPERYLAANQDVKLALLQRELISSRVHMILHGLREVEQGKRRLSTDDQFFSEKKYLATNPDVAEAITLGHFKNGFEHFILHGREEIRAGCRCYSDRPNCPPATAALDLREIPLQIGAFLKVPQPEQVKCSIIIPAYNNPQHTFNCVAAILRNTDGVAYEIIIVDDASDEPDAQDLRERLLNVIWIKNDVNIGYLRSCNKGAALASGEFIFLLNNDVLVQPGWLIEMLAVLEQGPRVGCVGAKVLFPDGRLQEAGGITFSDGSCWNYGRGHDPSSHEYCYSKRVDYVSGCALGMSLHWWNVVGGYSEEFAPAYCEDVDLAFKLRAQGAEVWFAPKAEVVHFEGASYGDDTLGGVKAELMARNQTTLRKKWRQELASQPSVVDCEVNLDLLFNARERSSEFQKILFIDHRIPNEAQDAGSIAAMAMLRSLLRLNQRVYFLPANHEANNEAADRITAMGIEVLAGPAFDNMAFTEWLKDYGKQLDTVFLSRPHIAPLFLDEVKRNTNAQLVYVAHDLEYVRLEREAKLLGDQQLLKLAAEKQKSELLLLREFDARIIFSEDEANSVTELTGLSDNIVAPLSTHQSLQIEAYKWSDRRGLIFVGGFQHPPNYDGVKWFLEQVWSQIVESLNGAPFFIVGSNMPDSLFELAEFVPGVVLLPDASSDLLDSIYQQARISVAPLRFGAGVKGKVVEAMSLGVPVVTTSIGIEGISQGADAALIADDPAAFSNSILKLYESEVLANEMSAAGLKVIRENFSQSRMDQALHRVVANVPPSYPSYASRDTRLI